MYHGNEYRKELKKEKENKRNTYKTYKQKDVFENSKNKNKVINKVKKNK